VGQAGILYDPEYLEGQLRRVGFFRRKILYNAYYIPRAERVVHEVQVLSEEKVGDNFSLAQKRRGMSQSGCPLASERRVSAANE